MAGSSAFALDAEVILDPLPFAVIQYVAFLGQTFSVAASVETSSGLVYDLRKGKGDVTLTAVPAQHLKDANSIVRARAECVSSRPLGKMLRSVRQYVVPLYQRKYTWVAAQWAGLWSDIAAMTPHDLGRVILYEEDWQARPKVEQRDDSSTAERTLVIVDGQQRLTSCCILLSVMRKAAEDAGCTDTADEVGGLLMPRGLPSPASSSSECLEASVLVPTEDDRDAFAAALLDREAEAPSKIEECRCFFRDRITVFIEEGGDLRALVRHFVDNITMLHFELDDGDAVTRYFEELHKRNEFLGTLLRNERPGVNLADYDLLRNFLLGHFADGKDKAHAYHDFWLEVERAANAACGETQELHLLLRAFLDRDEAVNGSMVVGTATNAQPRSAPGLGANVAVAVPSWSLYGGYRALVMRELTGAQSAADCEARVRSLLARLLAFARAGEHRGVATTRRASARRTTEPQGLDVVAERPGDGALEEEGSDVDDGW